MGNTIYVAVAATLDTVLGNLSQHVLEYERRIMEANVCWRAEKHREKMRPEVCPEGWAAGGDAYCYPLASLQQQEAVTLDKALQAKNADRPHGTIPARCDKLSRFAEKHGQFCYSACGSGFEPKSHAKCISKCEGQFPAETPAMCAQDKGMAIKAIMEMVTTVLNAGFSLSGNIIKMKEHGVEATSLSSTVQVFVDMGKPFANPICPVSNDAIAAPSTATSPPPENDPVPTTIPAQQDDQVAPPARPTCNL